MNKIALVTDGARGVGFQIVKNLCEKYPGVVYFTSNDTEKGKTALDGLTKVGLKAKFLKLDQTKHENIMILLKTIKYTEGEIDLLINNAEIKFDQPYKEPIANVAFKTLAVNYEGLKDFTTEMFYIMKRGSKIINILPEADVVEKIPNMEIRSELNNPDITVKKIDSLVERYIGSVAQGTCIEDGWGDDPYVVSKAFVAALTSAHQTYMDSIDRNVAVKCVGLGTSELGVDDEKKAEIIVSAALNN